jgi:hypothetical protein
MSADHGYGCQHYRTYDPASGTYKGDAPVAAKVKTAAKIHFVILSIPSLGLGLADTTTGTGDVEQQAPNSAAVVTRWFLCRNRKILPRNRLQDIQ